MVDTGAVASCISERFAKVLKLKPQPASQEVNLTSANCSPIESTGVVDIELSIQGLYSTVHTPVSAANADNFLICIPHAQRSSSNSISAASARSADTCPIGR